MPPDIEVEPSKPRRRIRTLLPILIWLVAAVLLWWALRSVDVFEIWATIRNLGWAAFLGLMGVNAVVFLLLTGRWWSIVRAQGHDIPYLRLAIYRLASFAISYFTPGPQFGGEPLQAHLISAGHAMPVRSAVADIALDKILELLVNFTFLALGALAILRLQFLPDAGPELLIAAIGMASVPALLLALMISGRQPLSWLLQRVPLQLDPRLPGLARLRDALIEVESQVGVFCRVHPVGLLRALFFSILSWVGLVLEYWLMVRLLGAPLGLVATIGVMAGARFAFLTPLPAGIGALEASQVLAFSALGYPPTVGISVGLLIRGRDVLFGGLGAIAGWVMARSFRGPRRLC
jgi:uncharacterized protein (TIRG00374 family)